MISDVEVKHIYFRSFPLTISSGAAQECQSHCSGAPMTADAPDPPMNLRFDLCEVNVSLAPQIGQGAQDGVEYRIQMLSQIRC